MNRPASMGWPPMKDFSEILLAKPKVTPPLDPEFRPISIGNRQYRTLASTSKAKVPLAIALERNHGYISVFQKEVLPPGSGHDAATRLLAEQLVKFLLWQRGAWKITIGGPRELGDFIAQVYSRGGTRAVDVK